MSSGEFRDQVIRLKEKELSRAKPKSRKAGNQFDEFRDVNSTLNVSQWLLGSVSDQHSANDETFPVVTKKIRDEVVLNGSAKPFRRSGLYLTLKVFLQVGLTIHLGEDAGKTVYKIFMLKFLSEMCDIFNGMKTMDIDCDVAVQCLAKTARRIEKLSTVVGDEHQCHGLWISSRSEAIETISNVRKKLDEKWESIQSVHAKERRVEPMPELHFQADKVHRMEKLSKCIASRKADKSKLPIENSETDKTIYRHYGEEMPSVDLLQKSLSEIERLQYLIDVENWILGSLNETHDVKNVRRLAKTYFDNANCFYAADPIGYSRMVLAMLKVIQVIVIIMNFF